MAAHAQGKFWAMHDVLFAHNEELGREQLEGYAKEAGLDVARFVRDLDGGALAEQVDGDLAEAARISANGTPMTFVNGLEVAGARPFSDLKAVIDAALEK